MSKKIKKKGNTKKKSSSNGVYKIVKDGDPRLHQECIDVDINNHKALTMIASKMRETMNKNNGVGLHHVQCDTEELNLNMFIMRFSNGRIDCIVNPEIVYMSSDISTMKEGCLSIRGEYNVTRANEVEVEYYSLNSKKVIKGKLNGIDSRVFQHEFCHGIGRLINDY